MKRILCLVIGHDWSKWKYTRTVGRYDERLDRFCYRCNSKESYTGEVEFNKKGEKIPHT